MPVLQSCLSKGRARCTPFPIPLSAGRRINQGDCSAMTEDSDTIAPSNDNHSEDPRIVRIKRMRFRAWHRGIKEMDLLMGGFADLYLADMSDSELDSFERIMTVPDQELYGMLVRDEPRWPDLDQQLMDRFVAHCLSAK